MSDGSEIDAGYVGVTTGGNGGNEGGQNPPAATTYTVIFKDHDGTELKKETVEAGKGATAPADPTRDGYIFTGWDKAFDNVTSDLTVTAQYQQDNTPTLIVGNETAEAGDTKVEVLVGIKNNPGLIGLTMVLEYDDTVLTVTRAGTEAAFDELSYQKPADYKNGCNLIFYGAEVEEVIDDDAFYLRFDVAEDAPAGTYPIKLTVVDAYSNGRVPQTVSVVSGSIVVE
jgi:hypothetical protein